jgi:hypothetical protein
MYAAGFPLRRRTGVALDRVAQIETRVLTLAFQWKMAEVLPV